MPPKPKPDPKLAPDIAPAIVDPANFDEAALIARLQQKSEEALSQGLLAWPHYSGVNPWDLFLKSYKTVIGLIDRDLQAAAGLNLSQYEIIIGIHVLGGRARLVDIARRTLLSQSRISRQIDTLQHKGLLYRETIESQPRATYAVLTEEGVRVYDEAMQPFLKTYYLHFLDLLEPKDVDDFTRVMAKLVEQGKHKRASVKTKRSS